MPKVKPSKWKKTECRYCDGCGWVEGGKTIKTTCPECKGKGSYRVDPRTGLRLNTRAEEAAIGRQAWLWLYGLKKKTTLFSEGADRVPGWPGWMYIGSDNEWSRNRRRSR